jgi:hypothetical protein
MNLLGSKRAVYWLNELNDSAMKTTVFSIERWNLSFQTSVQLTGTETSIDSGFIHSSPF